MKRLKVVLWLLIMLISISSCRKDLCFDHNHNANISLILEYRLDWKTHTDIEIDPDWDLNYGLLIPEPPTGVRFISYSQHDSDGRLDYNLPTQGSNLTISSGTYDLLFHNNDSETLLFEGEKEQMYASTRATTRSSYNELYPEEHTVNSPDMLYAAYYPGYFIEDQDNLIANGSQPLKIVEANLSPRVFSYVFRYEFESGLEYVVKARGALSGMARGVKVVSGSTPEDQPVTLFFDANIKKYGVEGMVRSFGVPGITMVAKEEEEDQSRASNTIIDANEPNMDLVVSQKGKHKLTLELILKSGKQKMIEFDVTDQLHQQPRGGVIQVKGIVITADDGKPGEGGDGGWDTDIGDWDDNVDVVIPIG